MALADIYFAYKNYINVDYGAKWGLIRQLVKKHNIDERRDRVTTKYVTEDIEKSNILIKKGYYAVSFNDSKVSSVGQIKDFYLHHTGIGCDICFATDRGFQQNSDVHIIVKKEEDIARIAEHVESEKTRSEGMRLIGEFHKLLHVLLIDGKHHFVTYWQEPECGKRGLIIYTLEGESLKKVFADHSEAT